MTTFKTDSLTKHCTSVSNAAVWTGKSFLAKLKTFSIICAVVIVFYSCVKQNFPN